MSSFIFFPVWLKCLITLARKKSQILFLGCPWILRRDASSKAFSHLFAFPVLMKALSALSAPWLLPQPCFVSPFPAVWPPDTAITRTSERRVVFFFTSGHLRARATGSLTNWASNKGLKQPQGLSAPEVSWKAQALMDGVNGETGLLLSNGRPYLWYELRGVCFRSPTAALILWWQLRLKKLFPHLRYHSCISAFIQVWAAQSCVNSEEREESSVMFWEKAIGLICGEACFAFFLCPMNSTEATYRKYTLVLYHYLKAIYAYRYCI